MGDSTQLMTPGIPPAEVATEGSGQSGRHCTAAENANNSHDSTVHSIPSSCSAFDPYQQQGSSEGGAHRVTRAPDSFIPQMVSFLKKGADSISPAPELRKCFTKPAEACRNEGADNENDDLVMFEEDVFEAASGRTYVVQDMLGQGTFGQVAKCWCQEAGEYVAVKVIKNQAAYYHQARMEIEVLRILNSRCDPEDKHHIVRLQDCFVHKNHLCLVFEMLSINLYELVKHNQFRGFSMNLLRVFMTQILDAMVVLRDAHIIHCDLKPENVLLKGHDSGEIKVIDFGSACFANRTVYSYIQSRFYRSPEVLLGHPYTMAIDMWSFGCVAAEMFLGLPLFPGASEYDLLARIIEMLGTPPDSLLARAKHTAKYFANEGVECSGRFRLRSQEEFVAHTQQAAPVGKRYFKHSKLGDIIGAYPMRPGMTDAEMGREKAQREAFLDLLLGVLELEPSARWSPRQALQHPFFTGREFTGPFQPQADPIRTQPVNLPATPPLQIPGGSAAHMSPMTNIGPYEQHAKSWAPGSWGGNHTGSAGPSSLGTGLGGVVQPGSWAAISGSPAMVQMHAHAAAMAAISQMSPQMSPLAPVGGHGSFQSGHSNGGIPQSSLGFGYHSQAPQVMGNQSHGGSLFGTHMSPHSQQAAMSGFAPTNVSMTGAASIPPPTMMHGSGYQQQGFSPASSLGSHIMGLQQQHSYHSAIAHAAAVQALGRSAPQVGYAYSTSPAGAGGYCGTPTQQYMQHAVGNLSGSQAMSAASIAAAMAARNSQYAPHQVAHAAAQAAFQASSAKYNSLPAQMESHGFWEQQSLGKLQHSNLAGSLGSHHSRHRMGAATTSTAMRSPVDGDRSTAAGLASSEHVGQSGLPASYGYGSLQCSQLGGSTRQGMGVLASDPPLGVSPNSAPTPSMIPSFPAHSVNPDPEVQHNSPAASASPEPGDPADYLPWFSDDQLIEEPSNSGATSRRQSRDRRHDHAPRDPNSEIDSISALTLKPCANDNGRPTSSSVPDDRWQRSLGDQRTSSNGAHRGSHPPSLIANSDATLFHVSPNPSGPKVDSSGSAISAEYPPGLALSPGLQPPCDED